LLIILNNKYKKALIVTHLFEPGRRDRGLIFFKTGVSNFVL
jgi:hypothetical protein